MSSNTQTDTSPAGSASLSDIDRSAARYLLATADLSDGDASRVTTGELQKRLGVAPASVTEMIAKLADAGLVDYEKYHGVRVTDQGEAIATELGWRFCVVSTFFQSALETTLDDDTAFGIGFVLPKNGVFRLQRLVDSTCLGLCPDSNGNAERCVA